MSFSPKQFVSKIATFLVSIPLVIITAFVIHPPRVTADCNTDRDGWCVDGNGDRIPGDGADGGCEAVHCGTGTGCGSTGCYDCTKGGGCGGGDTTDTGGGGGGGGSCFLPGTKVSMADGTKKNIEEIKVGDRVVSMDADGAQRPHEVKQLESPVREGYYEVALANGTTLRVTSEHPLYVKKEDYEGWGAIEPEATLKYDRMTVVKIAVGDGLKTESGSWTAVLSMIYHPGAVRTYNLKEVDSANTFYADGVLAHNKRDGDGGNHGDGGNQCNPGATTCGACSVSSGVGTQACTDGCNSSTQSCCNPGATTCGACSVSSGVGTKSCSDGCNSSTQSCCVDAAPTVSLVSPATGQKLAGNSTTLTWGADSWGYNCAGGSNTFTVYVNKCPIFAPPTTVWQSGLPQTTTSGLYSGEYASSYCWAVTASNGVLSASTFPRRWTFIESNWWQAAGGDVTAVAAVQSIIPEGLYLVNDPPGVVMAGSGTANLNGAAASSLGWLVANADSDVSTRLVSDYGFAYLKSQILATVNPTSISAPIDVNKLTSGVTDTRGIRYVRTTGDVNVDAANVDVGSAKVVWLVEGNVNLNGQIHLNNNQGLLAIVASGDINIGSNVGTTPFQDPVTLAPHLEGIFIAGDTVNTGDGNNQLRIDGTVVGLSGVNFQRDKISQYPSEYFVFRPDLTINAPPALQRSNLLWQEVAP